jgi:hypothetical protein
MIKQFSASDIEKILGVRDSETFGIYVGYQQIQNCIGPTKIGRTINVRALQRGRSQGGADWWFHSFWRVTDREQTYLVEKTLKKQLLGYSIAGNQNQKELYALELEEAESKISEILGKSII